MQKPNSTTSRRQRRFERSRGAVLPWILALSLGAGIGIMVLYNYLPTLAKEQGKNKEMLRMKLALSSAVDFIRSGLENRICFNDVWMENASCTLISDTANRSTERLMLMPESLAFLKDRVNSSITPLAKIEGELLFSQLTDSHPLKIVSSAITNQSGVEGFKIEITRLSGGLGGFPSSGRELQVQIRVELILSSVFERAWLTKDSYFAQSTLVLFPREIGSFALIVPGDLRLDLNRGTYNSSLPTDQVAIPQVPNAAAARGLTFASAVFVNRDLVLPHPTQANYTPIKFDGALVLGAGRLKVPTSLGSASHTLFSPQSGGGMNDRYFGQQASFGGFGRGVRAEGSPDLGLNCLFGLAGCPSTSGGFDITSILNNRNFCIGQANIRTDLGRTRESELALRVQTTNNTTSDLDFNVMMGASGQNHLVTLSNRSAVAPTTGPDVSLLSGGSYTATDRPSAQLDLRKISGGSILSNVDLVLNKKIEIEIAAANATNIAALEQSLSDANTALGLDPTNTTLVADRDAAQNAVAAANKKAKIEIELKPVDVSGGEAGTRQPHLLRLEVKIDGKDTLASKYGGANNIQFQLKAYELGDNKAGSSLRATSTEEITNTALKDNRSFQQTLHLGELTAFNQWKSRRAGALTTLQNSDTPYDGSTRPPSNYFDPSSTNVGRDLQNRCASASGVGASASLTLDTGGSLSFPSQAQNSWHFAPNNALSPGAPFTEILYPDNSTDIDSFWVFSTIDKCIVRSSVNFLAGFFTCNTFEIQARTTPLKIVGTVITRDLQIHPDALAQGVWWSSIYHPEGLAELRANGVLSSPAECRASTRAQVGRTPIWHPQPSITNIAKDRRCFAAVLRTKAEPFTWTRVDPDCFLQPPNPVMTCKKDFRNYVFKELLREESL